MTSTDTITTSTGRLRLNSHRVGSVSVLISKNHEALALGVLTTELLALIDAADPDAMRAYLRETAPEVIADVYRPEIPEADSPEDVDEHPEPVITVTPEALDAVEQLGRVMADLRDAYVRGLAR